jgi:uncharacterized protein (DUF4415 family)
MLARARPATEVFPKAFLDRWEANRLRLEEEEAREGKRWTTVRIDEDVLAHFVKDAANFDDNINAALRRAISADASPIGKPRRERA